MIGIGTAIAFTDLEELNGNFTKQLGVNVSLVATEKGRLRTVVDNGSSRGMLFPGTLAADYVIATAATAKFTAGTRSAGAPFTHAIMSPTGGAVAVNWADGGTDTFTMLSGFVYCVNCTKILLTGTAVTDLQIWV